jgi:hypothetical protein
MPNAAGDAIGRFRCEKCGREVLYRQGEAIHHAKTNTWPTCCQQGMIAVPDRAIDVTPIPGSIRRLDLPRG